MPRKRFDADALERFVSHSKYFKEEIIAAKKEG